ncbi:MAG: hypothetical protein HONBIEJF_02834 [Fimbriimonadaceae bacterium]|nr:hypothetical protein [Fimbriimonadaceae bacterium]
MLLISTLGSFLLLLVLAFQRPSGEAAAPWKWRPSDGSLVLGLVLSALGWGFFRSTQPSIAMAMVGIGGGLLAAWLTDRFARPDARSEALAACCLAVGVIGAVASIVHREIWATGLGGVIGIAVAGGALSKRWLMAGSLIAFAVHIINQLNGLNPALGSLVGIALVASGAIGWFAGSYRGLQGYGLTGVMWAVLAVGSYFLFASAPQISATIDRKDLSILLVGGVAVGALCCWANGEKPSVANLGLQGLLWLAAATYAFTIGRGLAMGMVAMGAMGAAILAGRPAVMAAGTPILALSAFRAFRDQSPDLSHSFDIGQHYALVGLLIGIVTTSALLEWHRQGGGLDRNWWGRLAIGGMVVMVIVGALAILGPKGGAGMLIGFGISPVFAAISRVGTAGSLGIAASGMAATILGYPAVSALQDWPTDRKMNMAIAVGIAILVLAGAAMQSARPEVEEVPA